LYGDESGNVTNNFTEDMNADFDIALTKSDNGEKTVITLKTTKFNSTYNNWYFTIRLEYYE
jgi:hypothetical protein